MKCNIVGIDRNNAVNVNPRLTAVLDTLDTVVFGDINKAYENLDEQIPASINDLTTDVLKKSLIAARLASHGTVKNQRQILVPVDYYAWETMTSYDSMNKLFRRNYGLQGDLFTIEKQVRWTKPNNSKIGFNIIINGKNLDVNPNNYYIVHVNSNLLKALEDNFRMTAGSTANKINADIEQDAIRREIEAEIEAERLNKELEDMARNQDPYYDANDSRLEENNTVQYYSVKDQILKLQQAFASAGISVRVEINPTLDVKGRVKAISNNTAIIELNPNKLSDDTHIHEFSHILVDLLGVNNPVVQQAITQLRGTILEARVKAAYPELSGEKLDKEIVVTAIGLVGAKINRTKPNLFQQIFNKIARALRTLFNVKEDAVEKLAKQLLEGRFDRQTFKGSLSYYSQESKSTNNYDHEKLQDIVAQVRIAVEDSIVQLERVPEENRKESAINTLKVLKSKLEKEITTIEQLIPFIQYANRLVVEAENVFEHVSEQFTEGATDPEERMSMITRLTNVGKYLSDFFDGDGSLMATIQSLTQKELTKVKGRLGSSTVTAAEKTTLGTREKALTDSIQVLNDAIVRMNIVREDYSDKGVPMLVDLLLDYHTPEINNDIKIIQDNNTANNRTVGLNRATTEYREIEEKYKGKLTDEQKAEKQKALVELANKQLEGSKIGRDTLISELREAQKDKSTFSYLADPFVYSSQPALQLFASFLKDHIYKASDDTREAIYRIAPAYKKFESVKGSDVDPAKFNEDLYEVVPYSLKDEKSGEYRTERILSFVQPYDMNKYNVAQREMYTKAAEATGRPKRSDKDAYEVWEKDKTKVRQYYSIISKWYAENTEKSFTADLQLKKLKDKKAKAQVALKQATLNDDSVKMAIASADVQVYSKAIDEIWDDYNKTYRGSAVMPNSKYLNSKFDKLIDRKGSNNIENWEAKSPAGEYYKTLMLEYTKAQKRMGYGNLIRNNWDSFSYMAPPSRAEGLEKIQKDGMFEAAKDFGRDTFTFLETDIAYGESINANKEIRNKIIPIYMHNPINEKFVSRDLGTTVVQFIGMANMFHHKSAVQGAVIMMADVIEKRDVLETEADGTPIIHKLASKLGYTRYKKRKKGKDSNNYKHLVSFIEANFYGEKEIMSTIAPLGKTLSLNKMAAKIATYTAMNNLAGNLLQATNQIIIDNIRMQEEAAAGEFFSGKDYLWAKKQYFTAEAMSSMQDAGAFAAKSKIVQAAQMFDAFQNYFGEQMDKKTGVKVLKAASLSGMFSLQHAAEHESAMTRMLALFKSYEGKLVDKTGNVIKTKEGGNANVYDVIVDNGDGVFKLRDDVYIKNADGNIIKFNKMQVINKISAITKKTNQIKSDFDRVHLQRHWGGKLVMLFRNYFVPSLRRHFGHMGFSGGLYRDLEANKLSEGTLFTSARFLKESISSGFKFGRMYGQLNDFEKANLSRLGVTLGYITAALAIVSTIMAMIDDDEDEKTYGKLFLLYQAKRVQSELTQFVNPVEFLKLASSPSAAIRPFQKGMDLIWFTLTEELPYIAWGDTDGIYYERKSGIHQKGDSKFTAKLEAMFPILNGIQKSRTPEEAVKWFDLPMGGNK